MTEELKIIAQIFNNVTDGAIYGGISFLIYKLIVDTAPWIFGAYAVKQISTLLQKVKITKKGTDERKNMES